MKEIKLNKQGKNKGKYVALVDDEDFESLNHWRWCAAKNGNTFYALRTISVDGKQKCIPMHCAIMNGKGVDHIDHDGLNNQRSNLRFCTVSQNMMNKRKRENTSSIYKGVYFHKGAKKWRAHIRINGKRIQLGYFVLEVEAAKAYNDKAIALFCEFANLNDV